MISLQNNRNVTNTDDIFDNTSTKNLNKQKEIMYNKKIPKQIRFFVRVVVYSSCFQRRKDSAVMVNKEQKGLIS